MSKMSHIRTTVDNVAVGAIFYFRGHAFMKLFNYSQSDDVRNCSPNCICLDNQHHCVLLNHVPICVDSEDSLINPMR